MQSFYLIFLASIFSRAFNYGTDGVDGEHGEDGVNGSPGSYGGGSGALHSVF